LALVRRSIPRLKFVLESSPPHHKHKRANFVFEQTEGALFRKLTGSAYHIQLLMKPRRCSACVAVGCGAA
jgi:hypothetical protein